jgi:membrane associated rhomboid family serine protease
MIKWICTFLIMSYLVQIILPDIPELKFLMLHGINDDDFHLWQTITFQFLHGDLKHLSYNIITILFIGLFLERFENDTYLLTVFLLSGAIGGLAQSYDCGTCTIIGAFASLYGLMGASIFYIREWLFRLLIIYSIYYEATLPYDPNLLGIKTQVAHTAHFMGGVAGIIISFVYLQINSITTKWKNKKSHSTNSLSFKVK